uniref:Putative RdRp n=1 Tax=Monilinia ourmiavirus B TaxID=2592716 RepID=A0A7G3W8S4_9VIRU|nr:putative RdRp [Monilinia ourmiavirus B]
MMTTDTKEKNYKSVRLARIGWVTGGNSACRAPAYLECLERLEKLTRWLEAQWCCRLPRVPLNDNQSIKKFCDELLDRNSFGAWKQSLRDNHLCLRARASVASTLFLFRKVVPVDKLSKADALRVAKAYIDRMTSPQQSPPQDFLDFASSLTKKIFRPGWDKSWYGAADSFCLPVSSCLQNTTKDGGVRGLNYLDPPVYRDGAWITALRNDYLDFTMDDESVRRRVDLGNATRVCTIFTGGKNRTISVFGADRSFLTPLHTILYNEISRQGWLLRGEADKERFSDYTFNESEVLVSGDYESATDNLNIHVSKHVLRAIRSQSQHVPSQVWDAAESALVAKFEDGRLQARGQLMGSLLSFPLLCLINYLTFKWAVPRKVPVKINGDDIVFRASPEEARRWTEMVGDSGLTLSKGKTLFTRSFFSLNSNFFLSRKSGIIEQVPHIRSSCVWMKPDCAAAVQGKIERSVIGMPAVTIPVHVECLRTCSKQIWSSQRSVMRGLSCTVSHAALKGAGLMKREVFYLTTTSEPLPLAPFKRWAYWKMPCTWRSVRVEDGKGDDTGAGHALVESTWDPNCDVADISIGAYLRAQLVGTYRYVPLKEKYFRMLGRCGESFEDICHRLPSDYRQKVYRNKKGERVWRRDAGVCDRTVAFTSAGVN